jgi:hypothetical protein
MVPLLLMDFTQQQAQRTSLAAFAASYFIGSYHYPQGEISLTEVCHCDFFNL